MVHRFELRRRVDRLVYRFVRVAAATYTRVDRPELTIERDPVLGWVARDPGTGCLAGRVWDVAPDHQGDCPPEGRWVSCKGARSYVYDLVHVPREDAA